MSANEYIDVCDFKVEIGDYVTPYLHDQNGKHMTPTSMSFVPNVVDNNLLPMAIRKFEGWQARNGAQATLTQDVRVEEWGALNATRIQTSGGISVYKFTYILKSPSVFNEQTVMSMYVKNIGTTAMNVRLFATTGVRVQPNEIKKIITTNTGDGINNLTIQFEALAVSDTIDVIAYQPKVEYGSVATPFSLGTSATHQGVLFSENSEPSNNPADYTWKPIQ
jgi:hypothetical protein